MKFIYLTLVVIAILFGTTAATKKQVLRQQVIDEFINSHDRVDKSCMAGKGAKCITNVSIWSLNYLRKQVSEVYDLKENEKALKKRIKQLFKDEKTGDFWKCVNDKMESCFVEDDETFIGLKKHQLEQARTWSIIESHRDDACYDEEGAKCEALVTDDSEWEKIQQQAEEIDQLDEEGASEEDFLNKLDELEADEETGEFWTCAMEVEVKCGGDEGEEEEGEEEEEDE